MKGKHLCWMKIALLSACRKGKRGIRGFCQTIEPDFNQINTFLLCQVRSPYPDRQKAAETRAEYHCTHRQLPEKGMSSAHQTPKMGVYYHKPLKEPPMTLAVNWPPLLQLKTLCTSPPEGWKPCSDTCEHVSVLAFHLRALNYFTKAMRSTDKMPALKEVLSGITESKKTGKQI